MDTFAQNQPTRMGGVDGNRNNLPEPVVYPGWTTVRKLGNGGFGAVYEIERKLYQTTERAALKVIHVPKDPGEIDELFRSGYDEEGVRRHCESLLQNIVREYEIMVGLKGNSNVVSCEDIQGVQNEDGIGWTIFIKMELLTPLMDALDKVASEGQIIKFGEDMCKALVLCHGQNIIHRDIKPQNIFLARDGSFKLGDFGIAKVADQVNRGTRIGTVSYMAPEVYTDLPYGSGADLYSLGVVLYWLLNEKRLPLVPLPPASPTPLEVQDACLARIHGHALPAPAHASPELSRIVLKACAYNPAERYASAGEMLRDLEALQSKEAAAEPAPAEDTRTQEILAAGETTILPQKKDSPSAPTVRQPAQDQQPDREHQPASDRSSERSEASASPVRPSERSEASVSPASENRSAQAPGAPAQTNRKKKTIPILAAVLALLAAVAVFVWKPWAGSPSSDNPDQGSTQANTKSTEAAVPAGLLADEGHAAWVAHGVFQLSDGTENDWNGKDTSLYEASSLTPIALEDVKAIDQNLYNKLAAKDVKYLYTIDLIFGASDVGWTNNFLKDGKLSRANGSYSFKICPCMVEGGVYAEDGWIPDPKVAHAESLTPDTLFMPAWQEEPDEYGFSWANNPVVTGGAGLYTLVVAQYANASTADQAGYGIGLVKKEAIAGLAYEEIPDFIPADHTYGIIGGFNDWDGDVEMTDNGDGSWSGTVKMDAGTEYMVRADGRWDYCWHGLYGNFVCPEDGIYEIIITFNAAGVGSVTAILLGL